MIPAAEIEKFNGDLGKHSHNKLLVLVCRQSSITVHCQHDVENQRCDAQVPKIDDDSPATYSSTQSLRTEYCATAGAMAAMFRRTADAS